MSEITAFDKWIEDGGPAALVIRENLIPVEGREGVFFPATYAAQLGADRDTEKFQGGYNIDVFPDGSNVCLVDSVGSQANRIEPIFATSDYADLVPQIVVTFPEKGIRLNLLHANHRAADAIVRCSRFEQELRAAFLEVLRGNAEKLAQFAADLARVWRVGLSGHFSKSASTLIVNNSGFQCSWAHPLGELPDANDN